MTEKTVDSELVEATLTDFANLYGNDDCLNIIDNWKEKRLGKSPEKVGMCWKQGFIDAIKIVRFTVERLKQVSHERSSEYMLGVYQASLEIIKDLNKRGNELA